MRSRLHERLRLLERLPLLGALTAGSSSLQQSMFTSHGRPAKFGAGMATVASALSQSQAPAPAPAPAPGEEAEAAAGAAIVPQEAAAGDERSLPNQTSATLPGEAASGTGSLERPAQSSPSTLVQAQQQQQRLTLASWLGISEQQITRFKEDLTRYLTAIKPSVLDEVRKENESMEAMLAKKEFREFKAYMQRMHTLEKKLKDAEADLGDVRVSAQVSYCST